MRPLWTLLALLLVSLLAGCSGAKSHNGPQNVPDSIENVQVTDTTGAIRGVVVDDKIAPLAGVVVSVRGLNGTQTSATDGGFVFSGLAAGDYFLTANKVGFQTSQASATVVAGQANPPVTRIVMSIDNSTAPVVEVQNWKAFLQCGAGVPVAQRSVNPCAATGSDNVHTFNYGSGVIPNAVQLDAVWTGTQPAGNELSMGILDEAQTLPTNWKNVNGGSPLVLKTTHDEIVTAAGNGSSELTVRVFPGDSNATVIVNQAYDVYMLYFYNFVPRDSYVFATDGPCDPITVCE